MRHTSSRYIIIMNRMPRGGAVSRDSSDNSAHVVSSALLKFLFEARRLGYAEPVALRLFGRVLCAGQDRRRRKITREQAFRRVESLAAAVPFAGAAR